MLNKILAFLGSTRLHRIAAAVVGVLTVTSGAVATYGSGFGLDLHTISLITGAIGTVIIVLHEFQSPQFIKIAVGLVKAATPPVVPPAA